MAPPGWLKYYRDKSHLGRASQPGSCNQGLTVSCNATQFARDSFVICRFREREIDCLTFAFTKMFRKIRLESKWNTTFWVVSAENFWEQRNTEKAVPFFRTEYSNRKFVFHFFKVIFDTGFRPSRSCFGKWNWFLQMVNRFRGEIYQFWILRTNCPDRGMVNNHRLDLISPRVLKITVRHPVCTWRCCILPLLRFERERMQLVYEFILLNKILRNRLLSEHM